MTRTETALELARECGFDLAGVAPLRPPADAARFVAWLEGGLHAGLGYLERDRDRILDPRRSLPAGRSLLVVGLAHSRAAVELPGGGRIARYAAGRDYHNVVGRRLRRLARRLQAAGLCRDWKKVVDAGPLLERSHAAEAGLGFGSKAANLLHPRYGPWFFLGELLLDADLEPTPDSPAGSCGTCRACLDACPTGAILEPGRVDARRCISYQTIENRSAVPAELHAAIGDWAFGCDVCSEVCPWGSAAPDTAPRWSTHALAEGPLSAWLGARGGLDERLRGSPLQRAGATALARNAAIVLGNRPSDAGRQALLRVLDEEPEALLRETAFASLRRTYGGDAGVPEALDRAARRGLGAAG